MNTTDNHTTRARTIALAGLFQAAVLVRQTGLGKVRDEFATRASIASILKTDAASVEEVFGGIAPLRTGLETLAIQLGNDNRLRDLELTGYAITLLHLERKLARDKAMLERMQQRDPAARDATGRPRPARRGADHGTGRALQSDHQHADATGHGTR